MDNIEITVFDEINDYKEKIYFFNFRQWIFAILIVGIVVPTYLLLKDKIGEDATSYIVIAIAGVLGFIGFVKIHELPAEKILPFWFRHYFCFSKPIKYITDEEFKLQHQKKNKKDKKVKKIKKAKKSKEEIKELKKIKKQNKLEIKEKKKKIKEEKLLEKAKKKYATKKIKQKNIKKKAIEEKQKDKTEELTQRLSKLPKEQQEALLKLLER
ncbi:MAG: PrgI family protein [Firmicutes bacterium]|nr:PrgI family protein [Bacillota bacterium]